MLVDAITTDADLRAVVAVLPHLAELRDHLRAERVRGRPVQPDDRDLATRLEQHGLLLVEVGVRLRIGKEALAGLLAEPALGDEAAQDQRDREAIAPFGLGTLERGEHLVEARARRRARTARAGCPAPVIMPVSISRRLETPSSSTRHASTNAFSVKRSTTELVPVAVACSIFSSRSCRGRRSPCRSSARSCPPPPGSASRATRRSGRRMTRAGARRRAAPCRGRAGRSGRTGPSA